MADEPKLDWETERNALLHSLQLMELDNQKLQSVMQQGQQLAVFTTLLLERLGGHAAFTQRQLEDFAGPRPVRTEPDGRGGMLMSFADEAKPKIIVPEVRLRR